MSGSCTIELRILSSPSTWLCVSFVLKAFLYSSKNVVWLNFICHLPFGNVSLIRVYRLKRPRTHYSPAGRNATFSGRKPDREGGRRAEGEGVRRHVLLFPLFPYPF